MLVYEDVLTKDEMFSDAFPIKEVDDIVYEVECKMITRGATQIDIGANPSAEGEEDAPVEEQGEQVNDVIAASLLVPSTFDKKSYLTYLRGYMKAIKAHLTENNPGRVDAFEKGAQTYAKKLMANFKDLEFYTGAKMDPDGMVAILNYREDGITPYFTFWKDGVDGVKH